VTDQRDGGIAWTDETWGPIRGCSRVTKSCINCYAESIAKRFSGEGLAYEGLVRLSKKDGSPLGWNGVVKPVPKRLLDPLRWQRARKIFVNSMSDTFHENLPDSEIDKIMAVMGIARRHTYQSLTKRPQRMKEYLADPDLPRRLWEAAQEIWPRARSTPWPETVGPLNPHRDFHPRNWPWVWLGVSVGDQPEAEDFVPILCEIDAALVWISQEPQHGPIEYRDEWLKRIDWIVIGGESGHEARNFEVAWARRTIAQARAAKVPVFMKQLGKWPVGSDGWPIKISDGHGAKVEEWPEDLRVREWPT